MKWQLLTITILQLQDRLLSGSNTRHFSTDQRKSFDERIINFITIQDYLLEIAVCSPTILINYPQNLTNADSLGQGNLNLVSEKSGKSQGKVREFSFL